jgi:hypothetical protein
MPTSAIDGDEELRKPASDHDRRICGLVARIG